MRGRPLGWIAGSLLLSLAYGCRARGPVNPSLSITLDEAEIALEEMAADPTPLDRPLIVLGGFIDPGLGPWWVGRRLRRLVSDPGRILEISYATCCTIRECRERTIAAVDAAFASDDPDWTTEVDVVGLSLGGVIAREACAPAPAGSTSRRRLRVARIFSLSSPHRGASLAGAPLVHPLQEDLRPASDLVRRLDDEYRTATYELFAYVRLGDFWIGPENAAPFGETPWWLSNGLFNSAHDMGCIDVRAHADIARRLRSEAPYATRPPAPIP